MLVEIKPSTIEGKKYTAVFSNPKKTVHFGQKNADDYTLSKNKEQRERYRTRHKKDLETNDPRRAGFLSYYLLWGDSTSLQTNIRNYKSKFNL
jgi:hypothetical protein